MNTEKLEGILSRIVAHPKLKERLESHRRADPESQSQLVEAIKTGLGVLSTGVAIFGGRKAKGIAVVTNLLVLLIEVAIVIKRDVIEDPEVRALMKDAWTELEEQSAALADGTKRALADGLAWIDQKRGAAKA